MEQKTCTKCGKVKSIESFHWKRKGEKRAFWCKQCHSEYFARHYRDNSSGYKKRANERSKRYRIELRQFIWDYLKEHPCVDCSEADPEVLDFDHKFDEEKERCIGHMIGRGYSLKKIKDEIAKCEIRCANCHRKKTAKERGWWQLIDR